MTDISTCLVCGKTRGKTSPLYYRQPYRPYRFKPLGRVCYACVMDQGPDASARQVAEEDNNDEK